MNEKLRALELASRDALRWLGATGDPLTDWEDIASWFNSDNPGYLRPGKDYAAADWSPEDADQVWRQWCVTKKLEVTWNLRAALAALEASNASEATDG